MQPKTRLILLGTIAAALVIAVVVAIMVRDAVEPPSGTSERLSEEALTPEEITAEVTPHPDGTLQVRQRLIFEAPPTGVADLSWWVGEDQLGWRDEPDRPRYVLKPRIVDIAAVELSTAADSTQENPAVKVELTVDLDDSKAHDRFPSTRYIFTRPDVDGGSATVWEAGRHVIDFSYTLDEVYLDIGGQALFVLPLGFPGESSQSRGVRSVTLTDGGEIRCLPSNGTFEPDADCAGLDDRRSGQDGRELTWRQENGVRIKAIGFAPPEGMQTAPIPAQEKVS
ncbi:MULTISPECIES: hypothetical protein [unclassified Brevibacterium]|uniref:hypothetical protein n=1 Tax=unclassified Brevibacterium TaxID=2614124 RepID=UPI001E3E7835|nr:MULTISPECIES: hypothetical protein [unclassified Brevibacterium]MCD1285795.1 hypothetical protein [Brevibacterium sp. CCUG 69071]MDK8434855.1 hypothetical protein [Brevibacterium sp. H-BE7]